MTTTTGPRVPDALINALIAVESGGKDDAVGDGGKAVGCLQIHEILVQDVNRIDGREKSAARYLPKDRLSRRLSIVMCRIYLAHYAHPKRLGREPALEDMARIWNGGPDGWREPETEKYWAKVRAALKVQPGMDVWIEPPEEAMPAQTRHVWRIDAPKTAQLAQAPAPTHQFKPGEVVEPITPDHFAMGREIARAQFTAPEYLAAQKREAWDRFAAAALQTSECTGTAQAAEWADALLAERRKRFPA
jgi:hypothetical protein